MSTQGTPAGYLDERTYRLTTEGPSGIRMGKLTESKPTPRSTEDWWQCPRCFQPFTCYTHVDIVCSACGYSYETGKEFVYLGERPIKRRKK